MHVAFVIQMARGTDRESLLSEETKRETQAVVMSLEDAAQMGFSASGVEALPGQEVAIIVVAKRDAPWVHRAIESSPVVSGFKQADVNID